MSEEQGGRASIRFRNDLKRERKQWGFSTKQMARLVGKSVAHYRRYESGRVLPPLLTALKLQIVLRCQLAGIYQALYQELTGVVREAEKNHRAGRISHD